MLETQNPGRGAGARDFVHAGSYDNPDLTVSPSKRNRRRDERHGIWVRIGALTESLVECALAPGVAE